MIRCAVVLFAAELAVKKFAMEEVCSLSEEIEVPRYGTVSVKRMIAGYRTPPQVLGDVSLGAFVVSGAATAAR